jgi:phosphoribosyl-AMP cyclohydrolase
MCQSSDLETEISALQYNRDGLIPAIAQQHDTGEVLMMAWMNAKSIQETLNTGRVCYWSRSRQKYWRKGEESGQIQTLKAMRFDCDNDTILLMVDQIGPACHTGRKTCFYKLVQDQKVIIDSKPLIDPKTLYGK